MPKKGSAACRCPPGGNPSGSVGGPIARLQMTYNGSEEAERIGLLEAVKAQWGSMALPQNELEYIGKVMGGDQLRQLAMLLLALGSEMDEIRRLTAVGKACLEELYSLRDRAALAVTAGLVNRGLQRALAVCIMRTRTTLLDLGSREQMLAKLVIPRKAEARQSAVWSIFAAIPQQPAGQQQTTPGHTPGTTSSNATESVCTSWSPIYSSDIRMLALCPYREAVSPSPKLTPRPHVFGALSFSIISAALGYDGPRPHPATTDMRLSLALLLGCGEGAVSFINFCASIASIPERGAAGGRDGDVFSLGNANSTSGGNNGNNVGGNNCNTSMCNGNSTFISGNSVAGSNTNNGARTQQGTQGKKADGICGWTAREVENVLHWAVTCTEEHSRLYVQSMEKMMADEAKAGLERHSIRLDRIEGYGSNVYLKAWQDSDISRGLPGPVGERLRCYSKILVEQQTKIEIGMSLSARSANGLGKKKTNKVSDSNRSQNSCGQPSWTSATGGSPMLNSSKKGGSPMKPKGQQRQSSIGGKKTYNFVNTYNESKVIQSERLEGDQGKQDQQRQKPTSRNENYIKDILDEKCLGAIQGQDDNDWDPESPGKKGKESNPTSTGGRSSIVVAAAIASNDVIATSSSPTTSVAHGNTAHNNYTANNTSRGGTATRSDIQRSTSSPNGARTSTGSGARRSSFSGSEEVYDEDYFPSNRFAAAISSKSQGGVTGVPPVGSTATKKEQVINPRDNEHHNRNATTSSDSYDNMLFDEEEVKPQHAASPVNAKHQAEQMYGSSGFESAGGGDSGDYGGGDGDREGGGGGGFSDEYGSGRGNAGSPKGFKMAGGGNGGEGEDSVPPDLYDAGAKEDDNGSNNYMSDSWS